MSSDDNCMVQHCQCGRNGSSHEPTFETSLTSNLGSVALAGAEVAEEEGFGALAPFLVYIVTTAPKHSRNGSELRRRPRFSPLPLPQKTVRKPT